MIKVKQKELLYHATIMLDTYCEGCLLYKANRAEGGQRNAHKFCIKTCTVGNQLKMIGNKLT
jgi:hypothetical protein